MDGLYAQLCSRGKVAASEEIQRDAERCAIASLPISANADRSFSGRSRLSLIYAMPMDPSSRSSKRTSSWCPIFGISKVGDLGYVLLLSTDP